MARRPLLDWRSPVPRRPLVIAVGALAVLLALTPFVPRGQHGDGSLRPAGDGKVGALRPADTAGFSALTPAMQAEIDRVVGADRALGRVSGKQSPDQLARDLVRCADFEGQRYCLGTGWTEDTEEQVQARAATSARQVAVRRAGSTPDNTGDLDARALLGRRASMSPAARAEADRAELTMAARSVAKVWLLRHEVEGVPLPAGFLAEHPEARAVVPAARTATSTTTTTTTATRPT